MELTIDELTALVFQHSRHAMQARKTAAVYLNLANELQQSAAESDRLAQIYLEVGKRINREREEKEGKMNLRRIITGALLLLLLIGLFGGSIQRQTLAQDVPVATETVTATAQPTSEITAEPNINVPEQPGGTLVLGWNAFSSFIGGLLAMIAAGFVLSLGTLIVIVRSVRQNELIKDFGQKLYMSQPVTLQQKEREVVELGKELVGLADDVTTPPVQSSLQMFNQPNTTATSYTPPNIHTDVG